MRSFYRPILMGLFLIFMGTAFFFSPATSFPQDSPSEDLYRKAPAMAEPAPKLRYPEGYQLFRWPGWLTWLGEWDSRSVLWLAIQQHFFFGSFILGAPMVAWLLEAYGALRWRGQKTEVDTEDFPDHKDRLAQEIMQMVLPFYPWTLFLGTVLLTVFFVFYAGFSTYMTGLFRPVVYLYAFSFFLESLLLYAYALTWDGWKNGKKKACHLALGALTVANGIVIICIVNSWMAFMMSPAGVDAQGRYLGDIWKLVWTPLWNPLNVHRVLASIMFSGAVIAAYAAYRMLTTHDPAEKAHYDRMGHVTILIAISNLFVLPFAGYWFARVIFSFRQRMGVTLMGGELSWLFVIQAILIGLIFLTITYYLWQGIVRIPGSERYAHLTKYIMILLFSSLTVWVTPHTLPASQGELGQIGGAMHPVVGSYGTMAAKNAAINMMILLFGLCLIIYKRCGKQITVSWAPWGNMALIAFFIAAAIHVIGIGVYGTSLPANIRMRLAFPQFITAMSALAFGWFLNLSMLKGAKPIGPIRWGHLPFGGILSLFILAILITMTMSLMGYIRSSARLNWHITEIMEDVTPSASTASISYAIGMVCANVAIFWALAVPVFHMGRKNFRQEEPLLGKTVLSLGEASPDLTDLTQKARENV